MNWAVEVEATDEADAQCLFERIKEILKTLDNGDYSGRVVSIQF
jgi:hypothetical protein